MALTGDTRPRSLRSAGGSSMDDVRGMRALGSWISGAAAHVSASVTQSIAAVKTPPVTGELAGGEDETRMDSVSSLLKGLEGAESILPARAVVIKTASSTPASSRPLPTHDTASFATAKASFTSLFTAKPSSSQFASNQSNDELYTLDLSLALLPPSTDSSLKHLQDIHKTATKLLTRYQLVYQSLTQHVHTLQQEAEAQEEEIKGERAKNATLESKLEAAFTRLREKVAMLEDQGNRGSWRPIEDADSAVFSATA